MLPTEFATLETTRELESKYVPQLFLGSLLRTRQSVWIIESLSIIHAVSYWPIYFLTVSEVFGKDRLTRPSSLLGEYRSGVTRSQVLKANNVYRFISLYHDCFIFFPLNMLVMPMATTSVMLPNKIYTNQKSVLYIIPGNKQLVTLRQLFEKFPLI